MALLIGFVVLVLWVSWVGQFFLFRYLEIPWDPATLGQWGDTFGALNALFAAFGFAAVFATLRLQQRQMADAQNEQHRQRFEISYFELLKLMNDARNRLRFVYTDEAFAKIGKGSKSHEGEAIFGPAWAEVSTRIVEKGGSELISKDEAQKIYEDNVHTRFESSHGPYYRLVYTILRRIKDDKILSNIEKVQYGNLLRSQFGSFDLALIAMNGLSAFSGDFKELIVEFRLLKYMPASGKRRELLSRFYPKEAFLSRD